MDQLHSKSFLINENPFDGADLQNVSFTDFARPSLLAQNENFFNFASLDILPDDFLKKKSLLPDLSNNRESLGILDISAMDLGRESLGIFNMKSPIFKRKFSEKDFNTKPRVLLSTVNDISTDAQNPDFNKAFLIPAANKLSAASSGSNPSFNFQNEVSKISVSPIEKEAELNQNFSTASRDPLNNAFRLSEADTGSSMSSKPEIDSFDEKLEMIKNRIKSEPIQLGTKNDLNHKLGNLTFNYSLVLSELRNEKNLDDSVFEHNTQPLDGKTFSEFADISFDKERHLLDSTPQPEWADWDSSKSKSDPEEKAPSREAVLKKVENLFSRPLVNVELKSRSKTSNLCLENLSQDGSGKPECSVQDDLSRALNYLSHLIDENDNLSRSQKDKGHHYLQSLEGLFRENPGPIVQQSEDSGHSSVDHIEEKQENINNEQNAISNLSCKSKTDDHQPGKLSSTNSPPPYAHNSNYTGNNSSRVSNGSQGNTTRHSTNSVKNCNSKLMSVNLPDQKLRRAISSSGVFKKEPLRAILPVENMAKAAIARKSGFSITPNKANEVRKLTQKVNKTSTPLQAPKLKPMASSTPTTSGLKDNLGKPKSSNACITNRGRISDGIDKHGPGHKSIGNIQRNSNRPSSPRPQNATISRRNSYGEEYSLNNENRKDVPKLKRSFSTGKESKMLSALSKVRQNILSSPYYNNCKQDVVDKPTVTSTQGFRKKSLSKISSSKSLGKENCKPIN